MTLILHTHTSSSLSSNSLGLAGQDGEAVQFVEGPLLQIESEHPYKHNTNEYTTVQVTMTYNTITIENAVVFAACVFVLDTQLYTNIYTNIYL